MYKSGRAFVPRQCNRADHTVTVTVTLSGRHGENLDDDASDLGLGGSRASSHSHRRTDSTGYSVLFPPENSLLDDFSTAR